MKILKLLVLLGLVLFPFGELLRFDLGNNVVIKPLDVVAGMAGVLWLFFVFKNKKKWIPDQVRNDMKWALIFSFIGLVSLLINLTWLKPDEFFASGLYLIRWVSYAALLPIILSFDEKFRKKLLGFLLIDGVIIVAAGFVQYFFFQSLKPLYYLGWDEHLHRMFATFFDPNFAGAFFVLFFLLVGGVFISRVSLSKEKPHPNPLLKGEGTENVIGDIRVIGGVVLLLTLIAIFLTFSRAALLMLIVGSITFLILIKRKMLIMVLLAAVLLFVIIASPKFYDENMNLFRKASGNARLDNYSMALEFIKDRPLFGVGFNAYRYAKQSYGIFMGRHAPSHADAGVDNSFLFVLATTGIVGLIAYCLLLIAIVRRAYFLYKKHESMLAVVVIASVLGLCVHALFINSLFFPAVMFWIWVLIALMESKSL